MEKTNKAWLSQKANVKHVLSDKIPLPLTKLIIHLLNYWIFQLFEDYLKSRKNQKSELKREAEIPRVSNYTEVDRNFEN